MNEEINSGNESGEQTGGDGLIQLPDRKLIDHGQITIPSNTRTRYDISAGDVVDLRGKTDGGHTIHVDKAVVTQTNTVRIPHRIREYFGLDDGDYIQAAIEPVGEPPAES